MNLSVIWRLQNLMTPAMDKVISKARSAQRVVDRANVVINRGFQKSGHSVDGLSDKIDALRKYRNALHIGIDDRDIKRANSELGILQRKLDKIERRNLRQSGGGGGILGGLKGIRGLAVGYGVYEAIGAAQNVLNSGMDMGAAEKTFEYFVKNRKKAQDIINQLKAFSNKNAIYENTNLLSGASMIADTMGADKVMPITRMVAKLAQGNSENYKGIITRLQQIKGTGYLQGDELMELLNRGVFGLQESIAKFKGISLEKFNKLKTAQKISYADVEAALTRMTSEGGKYDKVLDVINATAKGKWLRIKNTVKNKAIEIGKSTSNGLVKSMDWVIDFMNRSGKVTASLDRLKMAFKPILNGLYRMGVSFGILSNKGDSVGNTIAFISSVTNKLAWVFNLTGKAVQYVADIFEKYPWTKYALGFLLIGNMLKGAKIDTKVSDISIWLLKLAKAPFAFISSGFSGIAAAAQLLWANPVGLIALGVIALGAGIYYAWQNSEQFRRVTIQTWEAVKMLWNGAVAAVQNAWANISPVIQLLGQLWSKVMLYIKVATTMAMAWVSSKFGWIVEGLSNAFEKVSPYISKFWTWFKDTAFTTIRAVASAATFGLSEVGISLFNKFKKGYNQGSKVADEFEKSRAAAEKAKGGKGAFGKLMDTITPDLPTFKLPNMDSLTGGGAAGASAGVTGTVNGSVTKQMTINLNSPIATLNNYFNSDDNGLGAKIADMVLIELNKILIQGDRLALE